MRLLSALLLLTLVAAAELPGSYSLADAVFRMRCIYPAAEVTGRFADWRTPSIYRSHGGLHNGYDIAMPAGSAVPAVWPGVIVAVTPWTDTQVGITVQCQGGMEVTYGHLLGLARVGAVVKPGDVLGLVAVDHVDIKMRDASGAFYDFGSGAMPTLDPAEMALEKARIALQEVNELKERLAVLNSQLASLNRERTLLRKERGRLNRMVPQLNELVETGAMAAADEARLPLRLHFVDTRLKELETRRPVVGKQRNKLQLELMVAQAEYEDQALEAARYGLTLKPEEPAMRANQAKTPLSLSTGDRLEQLLKYGVLSKKEYEEARRRQRWDAAAAKSAVGGAPAGGQGRP